MDSSLQPRPNLPLRESFAVDRNRGSVERKPPTNVGGKGGLERMVRVRVLVADRDAMASDLLANALCNDLSFDASAIHPGNLLSSLATDPAAVVVIGAELRCDAVCGFDLAVAVTRSHPNCAVVMILNESTPSSIINAFRSGARGVFSRESAISGLIGCIDHVRKGFIWAGGRDAAVLLNTLRHLPAPELRSTEGIAALTARELQVVQCAAIGKTNKVIANELCLSEHTVKNYLFRAFEKLGVSSRVELLFWLTIRGYRTAAGPLDGVSQSETPPS